MSRNRRDIIACAASPLRLALLPSDAIDDAPGPLGRIDGNQDGLRNLGMAADGAFPLGSRFSFGVMSVVEPKRALRRQTCNDSFCQHLLIGWRESVWQQRAPSCVVRMGVR